jgi:hypothetical protein
MLHAEDGERIIGADSFERRASQCCSCKPHEDFVITV